MKSEAIFYFDLSISIISNNNLEHILPCLRSIFENSEHVSLEVFVVDNASVDETETVIADQFPQVNIVRNAKRSGFSTNNNMVLHQAKGRYLMILNDDTLITNSAIDDLVSFMDSHPDAAAVGAQLLNADGSSQPSYAAFPHPLTEAIWPVMTRPLQIEVKSREPYQVDSVCGAAMMVRREVLEDVGELDTDFDPIYSEEVDWCYRIKKNGGNIYTHPEAKIVHYGSQTMDRIVPQKYELLLAHKHLFFKKHFGGTSGSIYKGTLLATTMFKLFWWSLVKTVRPKSALGQSRTELHRYLLTRIARFD